MSTDHFGENRKSKTAIIALQQSHFLYKLRWLSNPEMKKVAEGLIVRELYKIEPMQDEACPANDTDFYGFASVQSEDVNPNQSDARIQCFQFLQDVDFVCKTTTCKTLFIVYLQKYSISLTENHIHTQRRNTLYTVIIMWAVNGLNCLFISSSVVFCCRLQQIFNILSLCLHSFQNWKLQAFKDSPDFPLSL